MKNVKEDKDNMEEDIMVLKLAVEGIMKVKISLFLRKLL